MYMTYGISWFRIFRIDDKSFLKFTVASLLLLSFIHIYISITIIDVNSTTFDFFHIITILILIIVFLSIMSKGIVPMAISCLGLVLLYGSTVIPSVEFDSQGTFYYKASIGNLNLEAINHGSHGFFLLGIAMVVFGIIIGYKPSILYTKNRPISAQNIWDNYPKWNEKLNLASTKTESLIGLPYLMTDTEKYLLWRYEFILVSIHDTVYQVPIYSYVPISSKILRESQSGKIIGLSKYGYFI
jgi:hypothetical protein